MVVHVGLFRHISDSSSGEENILEKTGWYYMVSTIKTIQQASLPRLGIGRTQLPAYTFDTQRYNFFIFEEAAILIRLRSLWSARSSCGSAAVFLNPKWGRVYIFAVKRVEFTSLGSAEPWSFEARQCWGRTVEWWSGCRASLFSFAEYSWCGVALTLTQCRWRPGDL